MNIAVSCKTRFSLSVKYIVPILIAIFLVLPACQSKMSKKDMAVIKALEEERQKQREKIEKALSVVVVDVEGHPITKRELLIKTNETIPQMNPHGKNISKKRVQEIEELTLRKMVTNELLFQAAEKAGVTLEKGVLEEKLERLRKLIPKMTLEEFLAKKSKTLEWFKRELRRPDVVAKYQNKKREEFLAKAESVVTEEYAKEYYENNTDKFLDPKQVRVKQIYIKVSPNSLPEQWEKKRERALWIIERAKSGDKFSSLAKEFSDDPNAENGGDTGMLPLNRLEPKIAAIVGKMKVGEISEPIYTLYGFYVVKVLESPEQNRNSFEKVKEKLIPNLKRRESSRAHKKWMKGFKKRMGEIVTTSAYKKKVN